MARLVSGIVVLVLASARLITAAGADSQDKPVTPEEHYQALLKEFSAAAHAFWQTKAEEEKSKIVVRVEKLPFRFLELGENNPKDPIALDALTQVITVEYWLNTHTSHLGWGKDSPQATAIAVLLRDHLQSDKLGEACKRVHFGFRLECEMFLRTVRRKSPHREVRAVACLRLAQFLANRRERLDLLPDQPELARRYAILYGKEYVKALQRQGRVEVVKEAATLYEEAREKYGDVKLPYGGTIGETAQTELFEIRNLAVGKDAPEIEGVDQDAQRFKLSDYRGKVVLLYFWSEY